MTYFFVADKIKNKEMKLVYCHTEKMIADFNSKPLQGKLFVEFRDTIMGIKFEDYGRYKKRYIEVLKQYELFDDEDDLHLI